MSTTSFTNGVTLTDAGWFNDADTVVYSGLTSVAGTNTITATGPSGMSAYAARQRFHFLPAATNTGATTINITPSGGSALGAKSIFKNGVALIGGELRKSLPCTIEYDGTQFHVLDNAYTPVIRSYLSGLTLSTAGSSATFSVAAGLAADSGVATMMALGSAISKTTSSWAVGSGNGALDTGVIATSTWYHVYLIMRDDTNVVDILVSTSASSPTMPTNYSYKRRIGAMKTDGSSNWTAFTQVGDEFLWSASVLDVNNVTPSSTAAQTPTVTVPTGVKVNWIGSVIHTGGGTVNSQMYISAPDQTDESPSLTATPLFTNESYNIGNVAFGNRLTIRTNTSAQIRYRLNSSNASIGVYVSTYGWQDRRGRDD